MKLIEIIGEAATKLSPQFRSTTAHLPWDQVIGMRHRLVHNYSEIDVLLVWDTTRNDLPALIASLRALVQSEPPA